MPEAPLISFREEVSIAEVSEEQRRLELPWGRVTLNGVTPALRAALRALSSGGVTEEEIVELVQTGDGSVALATLYYYLDRFGKLGLLTYSLIAKGRRLVTLIPNRRGFEFCLQNVTADARFRLSRFVYLHRDGDTLAIESPLSGARTILPNRTGAALIAELARPTGYRDLCKTVAGVGENMARAFVGLLASAAVISEVRDDDSLPEDANPTLAQWEFHDLLFHSRSRLGTHDYPVGATFSFLGEIPPLPALKPRMSDGIPLYRPDIGHLQQHDVPFTHVLEGRQSVRSYGARPITARDLGEFLYRAARVRSLMKPEPSVGLHYETTSRPYPSGGGAYDLEIYLTIDTCTDLSSGIYHYDPLNHQLCKLAERNAYVDGLLRDAQVSAALSSFPQVLISLASRFQRLSWKYRGLAYAATLKNVGVLYQTMYLVAAAMGLGACALGNGNSVLFAQAVGTDYFAESSVGEFILGSKVG